MRLPRQQFQHAFGVGEILRFIEDDRSEDNDRIRTDNPCIGVLFRNKRRFQVRVGLRYPNGRIAARFVHFVNIG